jgi:hypothetical protein
MSDRWAWSDHIPSGYDDMSGYGQVSCCCGWLSDVDKLGWVEHIQAKDAELRYIGGVLHDRECNGVVCAERVVGECIAERVGLPSD